MGVAHRCVDTALAGLPTMLVFSPQVFGRKCDEDFHNVDIMC